MPTCPACEQPLRVQRMAHGVFYVCEGCNGRSVTLPQLRAMGGDRLVNTLLRQLNRNTSPSPRPCPFCEQFMKALALPEMDLELDGCRRCGIIWFDPQELESVPPAPPPSLEELHLRAAEALAMEKIQCPEDAQPEPDAEWKTLPALLGLPVESDTSPLRRHPGLTWGLALLILVSSVAAFFNLEQVIAQWGLVPAQWWRHGGLTLLTAFFLHGGVWHLASNLYFLLIFGDNVEDDLGHTAYALLLLLATLGGQLVHILGSPDSHTPAIGASGGISGVLAYYGLQFPHAKISLMAGRAWRIRWLKLSARTLFICWLLLQFWIAWQQIQGFGNISGLAHLGGAAVGGLFWWAQRCRARPPKTARA